jgi:hypothetical protein
VDEGLAGGVERRVVKVLGGEGGGVDGGEASVVAVDAILRNLLHRLLLRLLCSSSSG